MNINRGTLAVGIAVTLLSSILWSPPASASELSAGTTTISWDPSQFVVPKKCTEVQISWNQDPTRELAFISIKNDKTQKWVMHTLKDSSAGSTTLPLCKEVTDRATKLTIELDLWATLSRPRAKSEASVALIAPGERGKASNPKFRNCSALWKAYPNGIAQSQSSAKANEYIKTGFRDFRVDARVYRANKRLDPGNTGILCPRKDEFRATNVFANYPMLGAALLPQWKSDALTWNQLLYGAQVIHVMDALPYTLQNGRLTYTPERLENFCWYWPSWSRDHVRNGILALSWGSKDPADLAWMDANLESLVQLACTDKGYPFARG